MATISSDESSTAPRDFQLSSSLDSGSRLSPNRQRCPLCNRYRKTFYCKECIHNGNFSSSTNSESYGNKQSRLQECKLARKQIEDECGPYIEKKQKVDALETKMRQKKDRIRILKEAIKEKKLSQGENKKQLNALVTNNEKLNRNLPKYEERVRKLGNYVTGKQEDAQKLRETLMDKQVLLKKMTVLRINQLMKYIFPVTKIQPRSEGMEMFFSSDYDMISALAEATRTTYVRNRWVYHEDVSGELQHSIVAPSLPGTGIYTAYNDWVAQNRDAVPSGSTILSVEQNPAYRISAALTYTAQLVHVLAFYLDVRLPYKLAYSDFCGNEMNEQQFSRRVARLNANVLQLCFSQNTDLNTLQPLHTLHNIMQLIDTDTSDLGRHGPMEVDAQIAYDLEQQLANDLQTSEDSDSEESDTLPYEWEAVPHVQITEATAGPTLQSTQTINAQQANSMAGGLVTSAAATIASIWRGWTGR